MVLGHLLLLWGLCHNIGGLGAFALHNKMSAEHRGLAGTFKAKKAGWYTLRQKWYATGVVGRSTSNHIGDWK